MAENVDGLRIMEPQIAIDANGQAMAVWYQYSAGGEIVWANRMVPGSGWGSPVRISAAIAGNPYIYPRVAAAGNGDMFAVWEQPNATVASVWSNRFVAGWGWGNAAPIEVNTAGDAHAPQVAADTNGNAIAVWYEFDGAHYNIWANEYTIGSGWGAPGLLENDDAGHAFYPQVAMGADGHAVAVWTQSNGTRYIVWSNEYVPGSGWQRAQPLESNDPAGISDPEVATDALGNAIAVWGEYDGTHYRIWANQFLAGKGWQGASAIQRDDTVRATQPRVAFDASGNAQVIWRTEDVGTFGIHVVALLYLARDGWQTPVLLQRDGLQYAGAPHLAVGAGGEAVAVWEQIEVGAGSTINVSAARYSPTLGWGAPALIDGSTDQDARSPRVAVAANGDAVAVWGQFDLDPPGFDVWANRWPGNAAAGPSTAELQAEIAVLRAELNATNLSLGQALSQVNASLLASLAAQDSDLLAAIARANSSLLTQLAALNATLSAKLTADNGTLWAALNASAGTGPNSSAATRADVDAARASAASANFLAALGLAIGAAGLAVAAAAVAMSRRKPPPAP